MSDINKIEPLHLTGVVDYHCHCDYSIDAEGSVADYCRAAIDRNLAEICFTTHYDTNPVTDGNSNFIRVNGELKPASPENLQPYIDDVLSSAQEFYFSGLSVKLGIEIGWYDGGAKKTLGNCSTLTPSITFSVVSMNSTTSVSAVAVLIKSVSNALLLKKRSKNTINKFKMPPAPGSSIILLTLPTI